MSTEIEALRKAVEAYRKMRDKLAQDVDYYLHGPAHHISKGVILGEVVDKMNQIKEEVLERDVPLLSGRCICGHDAFFHTSRGSQCAYGSGSDTIKRPEPACSCFSFRSKDSPA